jgi:hypothetical protein
VAYDPKNKAVCFFYSGAEKRGNYWVTKVRCFLIEKGIWNPEIILRKTNSDFIVSGVATIGNYLVFLAGGRTSTTQCTVGTYVFDGGDNEVKDWHLAWNYTDDNEELTPKNIKGATVTGRFSHATNTKFKVYGVKNDGIFDFTSLRSGINAQYEYSFGTTSGNIVRKRYRMSDAGSYPLYTIRMEGSYTTVVDRLDEVACKIEMNNSDA